jgi:flagellar motor protein MotB
MTGLAASASARRNRWAVSFADLLLLLLGFFVLLQASGSRRDALLAQVSAQFGGRAMARGDTLRAADLFVHDEALLTPGGRARVAAAARRIGAGRVELRSTGLGAAQGRFDSWDLAAARLGAVARELRAQGVSQDRLRIRGLDQADGAGTSGQVIHIAPAPAG